MLFFLYQNQTVIDWEYLTRAQARARNSEKSTQSSNARWMTSQEIVNQFQNQDKS